MKKSILLIVTAIIFVLGYGFVLFNNAWQLSMVIIKNINLMASFVLALIGVTMYFIWNRNKILREVS